MKRTTDTSSRFFYFSSSDFIEFIWENKNEKMHKSAFCCKEVSLGDELDY